jgi:SNF2 family DNA or RNA helicase
VAIVANYEAAGMYPLADWILRQRWDAAILDESHLGGVKTADTRTSQFAARLTPISDHRLALSGTFLAQQPLDAYGQFRFLDPAIFGDDYAAFLDRYAAPKQLRLRTKLRRSHNDLMSAVAKLYGTDSPLLDDIGEPTDTTNWLPGIKNAAQFAAKIDPITWRCRSEDVLDLPPLRTDYREVDLAPEQRRVYHQIEHELYGQIGAGVPINSVLTYRVRLQQATSGFVNDQAGHCCRFSQNPKRDALYDLLAVAGEPAVVFCRYIADLDVVEQVAKSLGLRYAEISGRRKDALTDLATLRPGIDVAGTQPQSGGVGIDLTRAKIAVWYSLAQSLPQYDQAIRRLHRPGTTGVRVFSIVASDTIEPDMYSAISDRRDVIEGVLRRLRQNHPLPALQSKVPY